MWDDSYHVRNVVRVHLIQILIIDVRIGKVKPVEQWLPGLLGAKLYEQEFDQRRKCVGAHPSTRSPMLSRWPRNVRQWYCWLVSISDVFWTHTSARVCWNTQKSKLAPWIQQRTAQDSSSESHHWNTHPTGPRACSSTLLLVPDDVNVHNNKLLQLPWVTQTVEWVAPVCVSVHLSNWWEMTCS